MRGLLVLLPLLAGCQLISVYKDAYQCEEGTHAVGEDCEDDVTPYVIPGEDSAADDSGEDSAADDSGEDSAADDSAPLDDTSA